MIAYHRKIPCPRILELFHYTGHRILTLYDHRRRLLHHLGHIEFFVHIALEHHRAYIVQKHHAYQVIMLGHNRKYISARFCDGIVHHLAERRLDWYLHEIALYYPFQFHIAQYGLVLVVCRQVAFFGQFLGIDIEFCIVLRYHERNGRNNHKRSYQRITARSFHYQENSRQRRLHHASHQSGHTYQRKIAE